MDRGREGLLSREVMFVFVKTVVTVVLLVFLLPTVLGQYTGAGTSIGIDYETESVDSHIWLHQDGCVVLASNAYGNGELLERVENYAFEGEQILCPVLVMDQNGIEDIKDVFVELAPDKGVEANCELVNDAVDPTLYNAIIGTQNVTEWDPNLMAAWSCTFTVETANSMLGEFWVNIGVDDLYGMTWYIDEPQYWYFNPTIAIAVSDGLDFDVLAPGDVGYSNTITVTNLATPDAGVLLNMFISGTDFYDPTHSGAKCPTSNVLALSNFAYYAENAGYHTQTGFLARENPIGGIEGYYGIPYEKMDPSFREEIIEGAGTIMLGSTVYQAGNVLTPNAEITLTFRLALPMPCSGNFDDGQIYFWAEAI